MASVLLWYLHLTTMAQASADWVPLGKARGIVKLPLGVLEHCWHRCSTARLNSSSFWYLLVAIDTRRVTSSFRRVCQSLHSCKAIRLAETVWENWFLRETSRRDSQRHKILHLAPTDDSRDVWRSSCHAWCQQLRRQRAHGKSFQFLALRSHLHPVHARSRHVWARELRRPPISNLSVPIFPRSNCHVSAHNAEYADRHHGRQFWQGIRELRDP